MSPQRFHFRSLENHLQKLHTAMQNILCSWTPGPHHTVEAPSGQPWDRKPAMPPAHHEAERTRFRDAIAPKKFNGC